jgi:hypothetical protein
MGRRFGLVGSEITEKGVGDTPIRLFTLSKDLGISKE